MDYSVPPGTSSISTGGMEFMTDVNGHIQVVDVPSDVMAGLLRAGALPVEVPSPDDSTELDSRGETIAQEKARLAGELRDAGVEVDGRASITWLRAERLKLDETAA